jgi:hypothetical protein
MTMITHTFWIIATLLYIGAIIYAFLTDEGNKGIDNNIVYGFFRVFEDLRLVCIVGVSTVLYLFFWVVFLATYLIAS